MNKRVTQLLYFWKSALGQKIIVALTGLMLVLFLAGHLMGNLIVFLGRDPFNDYAQFLHQALYGGGIWIARVVIMVSFILHITISIKLRTQKAIILQPNEFCNGQCSTCERNTIKDTLSSRMMLWSGLTILAFLIYHLFHFTIRSGTGYESYIDSAYLLTTGNIRPDAWKRVIDSFSVWYVTLFYCIAVSILCSHLSHGVKAIFQTLSLYTRKTETFINNLGKYYTLGIWLGYISIPCSIYFLHFGR